MALKFKVKTLDEVPEAQRDLYKEVDGGFQLDAEGAEGVDDVAGLKSALARVKRELTAAKERAGKASDEDLEELERLRTEAAEREDAKAREAGKWDEIRAKIEDKHAKVVAGLEAQVTKANEAVQKLTVTNELRSAISKAGVKPEYHDAVEAMLSRRGPTVQWEDGKDPVGIFADEVEGNKPISQYVTEWAKSEAASPYMPPENGGGGGGGGGEPRGGGKSWQGKNFADMTHEEQIAYTDEKYGSGAAA